MVKKKGPVFQPFQSKSFYKKIDQKSKTDFFSIFFGGQTQPQTAGLDVVGWFLGSQKNVFFSFFFDYFVT
jgi:hypothetical protein